MMEKKSKDLIPHERHIVLSISALAKVDLKNESEVLAKTSELVNSVKSLSLEATKLIEALDKPQALEKFVELRDQIHEQIRVIVTCIKEGLGQSVESIRNGLLSHLKELAHIVKKILDLVAEHYPDKTEETTHDQIDREDIDTFEYPHCSGCQKQIEKSESYIKFSNLEWHQDCFICCECQQPVTTSQFLVRSDKPICINCSPKCAKCGVVVTKDGVFALRKTYHAHCFSCDGCNQVICNTSKFYQKSGRPCCSVCISRGSVFDHLTPRSSALVEEEEEKQVPQNNITQDQSQDQSQNLNQTEEIQDDSSMSQCTSNTSSLSLEKNGIENQNDKDGKKKYQELQAPLQNPPPNARTLQGVLNRNEGIDQLINFCLDDYSVEKIFFWLDVEQYRSVPANEQTVIVYAKSIQHKYISSDAEMCLNLPEALREEIEGNINNSNCPRTIFDEAQTLVYLDMENDIFPRFFYSPAGKKYLAKVLEEEKRKQQRISRLGALKTALTKDKDKDKDKGRNRATSFRSSLNIFDHSALVDVINFEKRYQRQKFYVYEIQISRKSEEGLMEYMYIYRRYSEFFSLHESLTKQFPEEIFPPFPPKIFLGRSHIKSVTVTRMMDLDYYINGVISMKNIIHSDILAQFLTPTQSDLENYWFNKRLSQTSQNFAQKYH